jgi:hypothetical protein
MGWEIDEKAAERRIVDVEQDDIMGEHAADIETITAD